MEREIEDKIEQLIASSLDTIVRVCLAAGTNTEFAIREMFAHNMRRVGAEVALLAFKIVLTKDSPNVIPVSDFSLPADPIGKALRIASPNPKN